MKISRKFLSDLHRRRRRRNRCGAEVKARAGLKRNFLARGSKTILIFIPFSFLLPQ